MPLMSRNEHYKRHEVSRSVETLIPFLITELVFVLVCFLCNDDSTRLPPMWPEFDSRTRRHMWIEFVLSLLCFQKSPVFPSRRKATVDVI